MNVVVTGGTGFVGRALIDALLAAAHEVVVQTRRCREVRGRPPVGPSGVDSIRQPPGPRRDRPCLAGRGRSDPPCGNRQ
ncbi:MAG: NAD-dependent epimerase/dehydratase family protein [Verrucomicrobiales bacterium]|nr:NAD-dependent epimerase/dehydratase family protein [Verrucomicrobiales bacterium]MCP5528123.1 NAD-dependent epimerase/dehydratase family protein [Verrucomicrobiales bacterium]